MLSALIAPLLFAAPPAYEVALRTETRGSVAGDGELQINPALSLSGFSLLASYTPRILLFEPQARGSASLLHRGRLAGEHQTKRGIRVFFEEQILYGQNDFSWLVAAAEGGQPSFDTQLVQLPPLRYFSESTALGIEQPLTRRVRLNATASYGVSGGADQLARQSLPTQHGPAVRLSIAWSIRRRDALTASIAGSSAFFSTGGRAYILDANAGWQRELARNTQLALSLGVAGARQFGGPLAERVDARPFAEVRLRRERIAGHRLGANLRARFAPAVDPRDGTVYARAESFAGVDYFPIRKFKLAGTAGGARGLSGSLRGNSIWLGGIAAGYEFDRYLNISAGARVISQPTTQWVGFVAAALSYRELF